MTGGPFFTFSLSGGAARTHSPRQLRHCSLLNDAESLTTCDCVLWCSQIV